MFKKFDYIDGYHDCSQSDIVVPFLFELFKPNSVLDVGCGLGNWLYSFKKLGLSDVFGVDGSSIDKFGKDEFLNKNEFLSFDFSKELRLNRKFDLVLSLEVAEHLSEEFADLFIKSLTNHSDIIVFSAALPGQGGQGHMNEQYLDYWIKKFNLLGFYFYDPIRSKFWDNDKLLFWYKQNIVVFSKNKLKFNEMSPINLIHPELLKLKEKKILDQNKMISDMRSGKISINLSLKIFLKSIYNSFL